VPVAIFDMDGTLARNDDLAVKAAEDGLRRYYASRGERPLIPAAEEILGLVGLPAEEYFAGLVPPERRGDLPAIMHFVQSCEVARLQAGEGRMYSGVAEILEELRGAGWRLGLASNCMRGYLDGNLDHLLERDWFEVSLCLDDHPTKIENVRHALSVLGGGPGVMVGDRASDLEAGRASRLTTIGCLYGYGGPDEVANADLLIRSLDELPAVLSNLIF